jgi:hypothetical protein
VATRAARAGRPHDTAPYRPRLPGAGRGPATSGTSLEASGCAGALSLYKAKNRRSVADVGIRESSRHLGCRGFSPLPGSEPLSLEMCNQRRRPPRPTSLDPPRGPEERRLIAVWLRARCARDARMTPCRLYSSPSNRLPGEAGPSDSCSFG